MKYIALVAVLVLALFASQAMALTPFFEGFESYAQGSLDKNDTAGPNQADNGTGNPWWGPNPSNGEIHGITNDVAAHSGSQMLTGWTGGGANDQDYLNMAYRLNGGAAISGYFRVDWWFYDQVGSVNGSTCEDYIAVKFNSGVSSTADYVNANSPGGATQRLSLGMTSNTSTGVDYTKYQARVVGDTGGYNNGWYNLNLTRSVGWHQASIVIGAAQANGSNEVKFYIDDMVNPLLTKNSTTKVGYNILEVNSATKNGVKTAFFDDISITSLPEPSAFFALGTGLLATLGFMRRRKQS